MEVAGAEAERRLHSRMPGDERPQIGGPGVAETVEVGLDADVAVLVDAVEELAQGADEVGRLVDVAVDLDIAVGEHGVLVVLRTLVEGRAGERLRRLDVGLVERVDADAVPGDRGGELPEEELLTEVAVDDGVETRGRPEVGIRAEGAEHRVGTGVGEADVAGTVDDDGEDALPVLAERLRDKLFDPRPEPAQRR